METNEISVRENLKANILRRLGNEMIDIELSDGQLETCIDLALRKLKQRSDAFVEESLVLLTLIKNQKEYVLPDEIIEIQQIYRRGYSRSFGSTTGTNIDPFAVSSMTNVYMLGTMNGRSQLYSPSTFELYHNYMKTWGKMMGMYMNYTFNPNTHKLILAENPRGDDEIILLHSYVDKPDYEVIQDRYAGLWVENWAFAESMELLGRIRDRFKSLAGPLGSGISQDGAELKNDAKAMKEELTKELNNFVAGGDIPLMPFSG
nr:MAG TPA: neck protein [Caudoviricetes sp.]